MNKLPVFAAVAATLLTASVADARGRVVDPRRGPNPGGWQQPPADCPLTVSFGSYGPGIDRPTLVRMESRLQRDRRVRAVNSYRWGREGEITLCVRLRRHADARPLVADLRAMIPARLRGPVEVSLRRVR